MRRARGEDLQLTVDTILSPNLAKSGVDDGGGLTTTSTIWSPPLIVPLEGLSREMKLSPPPSAAAFVAKCCSAGWAAVGLVIRGVLGRALDAFGSKSIAEVLVSHALVEGAELLVATRSKTASAGTECHGNQQSQI